jgi:FkbM family methyltransferase
LLAGATVVDIGANIGLFGVRALSAVLGGDVTYIGVEPVPANFTALQYNLLGGTCSTVSTCGVGSTSGTTSDAAGDHGGAGSTAAEQSFFHLNAAYADAVAAPSVHRISRPYPGRFVQKDTS